MLCLALVHPARGQVRPDTRDSVRVVPNPAGAFWRSLAVPGWGQVYNGRPVKAATYAGLVLVSAGMAVRNRDSAIGTTGPGSIFWSREAWLHGRNNWLIFGGFVYLLGAVDAYVDAHLQTFDVSPISMRLLPREDGGMVLMAALSWPEGD